MSSATPAKSKHDDAASSTLTLADYILERLSSLGCSSIQGVPGDFSMPFLDAVSQHASFEWVGNTNELNAAYSADGYARCAQIESRCSDEGQAAALGGGGGVEQEEEEENVSKLRAPTWTSSEQSGSGGGRKKSPNRRPRGSKIAALCTTFGVGELSALNGIAGSYAERLPVLHIVGVPSTQAQSNKALLHHTLGDGDFAAFSQMSKHVSCAVVHLGELLVGEGQIEEEGDEESSSRGKMLAKEVDALLARVVREARPGYLALPTDLVHLPIPTSLLRAPLHTSHAPNEESVEAEVLREIFKRLDESRNPLIIVDACTIRHAAINATLDLVHRSGCTFVSTPMGKSALPESSPQYAGTFIGPNSEPALLQRVQKSDCYLFVGALRSDFNTASSFNSLTDQAKTIELHSNRTVLGHAVYPGISMHALLPRLADHLSARANELRGLYGLSEQERPSNRLPTKLQEGEMAGQEGENISQMWLWKRIGSFLKEADQVVAETGTSSFGILDTHLPGGRTRLHSQVLWGSIGWSLPATLGVSLAARELHLGRTLLFIGDGSLQLTATEISTMIRLDLHPILFVLRNDGYEIERQIEGPDQAYNNVPSWNNEKLLQALYDPSVRQSMGGKEKEAQRSHAHDKEVPVPRYFAVKSKKELDDLLKDEEFASCKRLQLVEIFMRRGDAPRALVAQAQASAKLNS
ncbi:putative PDC1-pyruvate decarboxylase, isozyme 1 [Ceraceosorus guamensis]|uniref:Putative PDC1-pyruvate decarboxylase, isozyme 1 n=1 Tax=Ceraceosorus guamensis TaxID=1522189 RepID=A0A316W886_9BASI|nr:putative PDC1-pyruvate decarboxylase, isozyme 1 [Ceraceosorus guamensis]PWN43885.1 putative PDC1-pyruvate decarboxylase, isozyme 1 [Ceraceosorus guamensis]